MPYRLIPHLHRCGES